MGIYDCGWTILDSFLSGQALNRPAKIGHGSLPWLDVSIAIRLGFYYKPGGDRLSMFASTEARFIIAIAMQLFDGMDGT